MNHSSSLSFDIDSIREIAQLLRDGDLGEICLETTGEAPTRLRLKRTPAPPVALVAAPAAVAPTEQSTPAPAASESEPSGPGTFDVTSHAVGVFREANPPVKVGDEVKVRQQLGNVESLRVPNEIVAPSAGRILAISTQDGQGVEYGQTLFVIQEI